MKDRKIKIELSQEAIKYTFKNAIQEVESLREFYTMYRDTWIKDKLAFEQKYAIALEINKVIEKLADSEDIENEYSRVKESMIGGTKFQDIIELNLEKSEKPARISYSMRKNIWIKILKRHEIEKINTSSRRKYLFGQYYRILLLSLKDTLLEFLSLWLFWIQKNILKVKQ